MRPRVLIVLAILSGLMLGWVLFGDAPATAQSLLGAVSDQDLPENTLTPTPLALDAPVNPDNLLTLVGILALGLVFGGGALVIKLTDKAWPTRD